MQGWSHKGIYWIFDLRFTIYDFVIASCGATKQSPFSNKLIIIASPDFIRTKQPEFFFTTNRTQ
jgi:hypothetical protein